MSEWQKIDENTPRDTEILAYDPMADARVVIAWSVRIVGGWYVCWTGEANPDCTLWQPLPAEPEDGQ